MAKRKDTEEHELDDSVEDEELDRVAEGDEPEGESSAREDALARVESEADIESEAVAEVEEDEQEATSLGSERYVHAAFFGVGILAAYLSGKLLLAAWNMVADWPEAVRQLPLLIEYGEEERATLTLLCGAVVGVLVVLWYYRKESVRTWAGEVALELSRVSWPNKDTVTNGTMVVLVASLVATVYVALLDRFWSYLTNLVYGA